MNSSPARGFATHRGTCKTDSSLFYFFTASASLFCLLTLLPHFARLCSIKEPGIQTP